MQVMIYTVLVKSLVIKWMIQGLIFYGKLMDTFSKFSIKYLPQIPPNGMVDDAINQVQVQQYFQACILDNLSIA